jgi:hypothetical protein
MICVVIINTFLTFWPIFKHFWWKGFFTMYTILEFENLKLPHPLKVSWKVSWSCKKIIASFSFQIWKIFFCETFFCLWNCFFYQVQNPSSRDSLWRQHTSKVVTALLIMLCCNDFDHNHFKRQFWKYYLYFFVSKNQLRILLIKRVKKV